MNPDLQKIAAEARAALEGAADLAALKTAESKYLGKKGELTGLLRSLGSLPAQERPKFGAAVNEAKKQLEEIFESRKAAFEDAALDAKSESFDLTEPGVSVPLGHLHPITQLQHELEDIFISMGFSVLDGPEVELEHYNFDALNIPGDHPARDMQDTFWCASPTMSKNPGERLLMRTHTSPVQVRGMERWVREGRSLPLKAIVPGRVFRNEALDASHEHTFWQMEGLVVGENINAGHLLGTLRGFLRALFRKDLEIRLRPGFFPFVEPGFEMDVRCPFCESGCSVCKRSTWIELVPSGLVHPNVLRAGGFDPEKHSGFAFGLGLSRLAMLRYGINDIRLFLSNDLRFLEQF